MITNDEYTTTDLYNLKCRDIFTLVHNEFGKSIEMYNTNAKLINENKYGLGLSIKFQDENLINVRRIKRIAKKYLDSYTDKRITGLKVYTNKYGTCFILFNVNDL